MRKVFITSTILEDYKQAIRTLAHFLGKRIKYRNKIDNYSVKCSLYEFNRQLKTIKFKYYDSDILFCDIVNKSFTYENHDIESIIDYFLDVISYEKNVEIYYIKNLFRNDSLLERWYENITYKEYVKHLKDVDKLSNKDIESITITVCSDAIKKMKARKNIGGKDFIEKINNQWYEDSAESHLECWRNRYSEYKRKSDLIFDLNVNHDSSLEIEHAEHVLGRELTVFEQNILVENFNKAVVKKYYEKS